MSHEIETHGTQAAAVFARKDAWHRLGTTVRDRAFTAEEAMRLGHLGGWDVRKLAVPRWVVGFEVILGAYALASMAALEPVSPMASLGA